MPSGFGGYNRRFGHNPVMALPQSSLHARVRRGDMENQIDESLDYDNPHVKARSRRSLTLAAVVTVRLISPFI